jgi:hypothetical protein
MALEEVPGSSGAWTVKLGAGDTVRIAGAQLEALDGANGRVLCFWGDARWSRVQLLGEIARGQWGLCRAGILDLLHAPERRWQALEGRLAFAPVTEMTEATLEEARRRMTAYRQLQLASCSPQRQEGVTDAD